MAHEHVVKVQDSRPLQDTNIHQIFSEFCGEIRNIYPCRTDKGNSSSSAQCFIQFVEEGSVGRACKLCLDGILVLAISPSLVEEYRSVMADTPIVRGPSRVQSNATTTSAPESSHSLPASTSLADGDVSSPDSHRKLSNKPARRSRFQTEQVDAMILDCSRALSPAPPSSTMSANQLPSLGPSSTSFLDALKSSRPSLLSRLHGKYEKENVLLEPPTVEFSLPPMPLSISRPPISLPAATNFEASNQHLTIVSASSFTLNTRLVMTLCDELISYDLETLQDDPTAIIDLLKATASERDKWIVVGCHYRRKGNFKAAISVVRTMVDVMIEHGMSDTALKPAFLMISSCETELSKRARTPSGENTEASLGHAQKSYHWLQKVYGTNALKSEPNQTGSGLTLAARLAPMPTEKHSNTRTPDHTRSTTPYEPAKTIIDLSEDSPQKTPLTPAAVHTNPSRLKMLERELQSLRDRESTVTTQLHNARSAKHKFEEDFTAERNLRRKLEHKLDDLEGQLDVSKKMENFALEQMKREVDARRRAEERFECEREKRKEVETGVKAQGTKPLFEDLANMFQRAAKGEDIILPNAGSESVSLRF